MNFIEPSVTEEQNLYLNSPIVEDEIRSAIKDTKSGRAPGLDGIPIDFYKEFMEDIIIPIKRLINFIFENGEAPYEMKIALISLIFKKGDPNSLKNYRPISLLNNDLKIMTKVMSKRLKKLLPQMITDTQFACPGRKISSAIHILRDIYDYSNGRQHENYIISIDFIKAYDSVDRDYLSKILLKLSDGLTRKKIILGSGQAARTLKMGAPFYALI